MSSPEKRLEILRAETEGLERYLTDMPKEAWDQPSACDEWCIADVVAHLTQSSRNYPSRVLRALQGDASPDAMSSRLNPGEVDPENLAQRAVALRKELGGDLLPEFLKANQAIVDALANISGQDWDKPVFRPYGPEPLRNIVDMLITERAVHGWDIRSPFDSQTGLSPESVAVIVERIPQRPTWWSFRTEAGFAPLPFRYRFEVTPPAQYRVDLVVTEERRYMEVASKEDAHVTFQCAGETFVFLMYGRINPEAAIADGRMSYAGDQELVNAFVQRFTGG